MGMTTVEQRATAAPTRPHRLYWWREAILIVGFYLIYSWSRNQFGSARIASDGVPERAFNNAMKVIRAEQAVGLFHEKAMQGWFLGSKPFMQFWNAYYGVAHFVVTIGVFIVLYKKRPDVFPIWRNTILLTTGLAIIGFSLFPLMPPRLLDQPCPADSKIDAQGNEITYYGGDCIFSRERPLNIDGFGFVDSLEKFGGPWSFDNEAIKDLSNQYAAMPSLHIGWSTWCAFAMWPLLRKKRWRAAMLLYPMITLTCIIVTANHYWLDGVGGLVVLGVGFVLGWTLHQWNQSRLDHKFELRQRAAAHGPPPDPLSEPEPVDAS